MMQRRTVIPFLIVFALFPPFFIGSVSASSHATSGPAKFAKDAKAFSLDDQVKVAEINYYNAETHPRKKSFLQDVTDNTTALVAIIGGLVAVFSLWLNVANFRGGLRTQKDTQFYDALRRMGDGDSVAGRAVAAGLLAQLAKYRIRSGLGLDNYHVSHRQSLEFPFFETALDQLIAANRLESNPVVLSAFADALAEITYVDQTKALRRLRLANFDMQQELLNVIASYLSARNVTVKIGEGSEIGQVLIDEERDGHIWAALSILTGYRFLILKTLIQRRHWDFVKYMRLWSLMGPTGIEDAINNKPTVEDNLKITSSRLRSTISALCACLRTRGWGNNLRKQRRDRSPYSDLTYVFLVDAELGHADLSWADLAHSQLDGAYLVNAQFQSSLLVSSSLRNCELVRADFTDTLVSSSDFGESDMKEAYIAECDFQFAKLEQADWWHANFINRNTKKLNTGLLSVLFLRWERYIPTSFFDVDKTIIDFLEDMKKNRKNFPDADDISSRYPD